MQSVPIVVLCARAPVSIRDNMHQFFSNETAHTRETAVAQRAHAVTTAISNPQHLHKELSACALTSVRLLLAFDYLFSPLSALRCQQSSSSTSSSSRSSSHNIS
jgi:hypothetical protein